MSKQLFNTAFTFIFLNVMSCLYGQTGSNDLWRLVPEKMATGDKVRRSSFPKEYHIFKLDLDLLKSKLVNAPVIHSSPAPSSLIIEFPNSDGQFERFAVYESSIMEPGLEAKFPMIKTYAAQGIDDPTATMRFSVTQFGLHTMALSGIKSANFIDPFTTDLVYYIVYDRNSLGADNQNFTCLTDEKISFPSLNENTSGDFSVQNINDKKLRTYRLAQSCNAEYGNLFAGTSNQKANIQAQMTITINRVNTVYERDL
ncbi:MAG: hypothetical protein JNM51_11860, partial [Bacteroidia bacterium]|nr:hypothetical protein [Bacteroidia bacterium]